MAGFTPKYGVGDFEAAYKRTLASILKTSDIRNWTYHCLLGLKQQRLAKL